MVRKGREPGHNFSYRLSIKSKQPNVARLLVLLSLALAVVVLLVRALVLVVMLVVQIWMALVSLVKNFAHSVVGKQWTLCFWEKFESAEEVVPVVNCVVWKQHWCKMIKVWKVGGCFDWWYASVQVWTEEDESREGV